MFVKVHEKLVHPVGENLRHIPIKIYLPSVDAGDQTSAGHLRVVQGLVAPFLSSRKYFVLAADRLITSDSPASGH